MFETSVTGLESTDGTRERLLEAAGEVFADKGFASATVREICQLAGANLAAINYHFGGKERLYAEVLRYADEVSEKRTPQTRADLASLPAEEQLKWFVGQFLKRVFDAERPAWHDRLIAREMVDPTPALEELAQKNIKPRAMALQRMIRSMLGEKASDREVQMHAASVVGQCLMYHRCRAMLCHLMPAIDVSSEKAAGELTEHIAAFSLRAIRERRAELEGE
jgi:AcrR family transcriptional regulator